MNSEKLFQILSYAAVFCGFFALWVSGVFGIPGTVLFISAMTAGWLFEGRKWQISERIGTALIVLALPVYYLLWRAGLFALPGSESALPGILARLIVTLSAIKILQRKSDRDWIFLYLMAFFEVLLAAGLSISALYLATFIAYAFIMVCTVVLFEIRKTSRSQMLERIALDPERDDPTRRETFIAFPARRIPTTAVVLIIFIVFLAAPLFFLLPRVGGAGFGAGSGGGANTQSGFADSVRLGGIGSIQQNDEIVMRVSIDGADPGTLEDIRWRGIALDSFDNKSWRKSKPGYPDRMPKGERDLIQVDTARGRDRLVIQNIYLEPLNSPVMFVLPRAIGIQTGLPHILRDEERSLSFPSKGERVNYRVLSDTTLPDIDVLRQDNKIYPKEYIRYLQLPSPMDERITQLASSITKDTHNRYDAARAVETYLQTQFGYTLEQKAGGEEPLADFLFNVREGHCEYFATAMAVMLRTQGVATRVVNGFQRGEYNDTAGVFVIRQRNAHSWVEVYFPAEDAWITFDPTPYAGQNLTSGSSGITKRLSSYLEALEIYWIQYFVAYDSAEQRSLLTSVRRGIVSYGNQTTSVVDSVREAVLEWWRVARGDEGFRESATAVGWAAGGLALLTACILLFVWVYRWVVKSSLWQSLRDRLLGTERPSIVEFYERMQTALASKGLVRKPHQTPLEFAYAAGMPEVIRITERYNRVRFGDKPLTRPEAEEIENWLDKIAEQNPHRSVEPDIR